MKKMLIGFDASPISGNKTGVEYYALRLYSALKHEVEPFGNIIAFSNAPIREIPEAVILKSSLPLFLWRQIILPRELKRRKITSLHSPVTAIPIFASCPLIATVHDVSYRIANQSVSFKEKEIQLLNAFLTMHHATYIIAVSETTASRLKSFYPQQSSKIRTVLSGALANFRESSLISSSAVAKPYLLQLGRIDFRKNPLMTLEAFRISEIYKTHTLVFAGAAGNASGELADYLEKHPELAGRVILTGYLQEDVIPSLLANASALLYPSVDEGFGHPPLEALAAGTLPIVSNIPVFHELLDNGAVFVDNANSLANALRSLAEKRIPVQELVSIGKSKLELLQWSDTARKIIKLHSECLKNECEC